MMRTVISALVVVLGLLVPSVASAQSEQVFYYYEDATGSVRMITDATGQAVEWHDYQPFGEETLNNPQTPERRLYTGKERDSETNYDYSMARYYAGLNGRFTTVDPGHVAGDVFNPQTWNGYAYALNNPLRYIDPNGYADGCVGFQCSVTVIATDPYNPLIWNPSPEPMEEFPVKKPDPPKAQMRTPPSDNWLKRSLRSFGARGCNRLMVTTFVEDFIPTEFAGAAGPNDFINEAPKAAYLLGASRAVSYSISQGLTSPMKSSVYRAMLGRGYGFATMAERYVLPLQIAFATSHAIWTAGSAAYNAECR